MTRTFERLIVGHVPRPGRVPVQGELPQLEVGDGEADDGCLVQL